jgi:GxxExxY protein
MKLVEIAPEVNELTAEILRSAFRVSNVLGCGFLEKVYENALAIELRSNRMPVLQQPHVDVEYNGHVVGEYVADLIVANRVVVEVKAVRAIERAHESQVLNYLKATRLEIALLLNFGRPRLEYRRMVWKS